jgi:hypothetical protein
MQKPRGSVFGDAHMALSSQGVDIRENVGDAVADIFIVGPLRMSRRDRDRIAYFTDQSLIRFPDSNCLIKDRDSLQSSWTHVPGPGLRWKGHPLRLGGTPLS